MSEDLLRQIEHRGRTATAILSAVREVSPSERERFTDLMLDRHTDEIESLREKNRGEEPRDITLTRSHERS